MMRLKRKLYSDDEKKGSNLGKIALGTGIAAAGAFAAGRRGLLGQNIAKSTNIAWGKLGNTLGSKSMVSSATKKYIGNGLGISRANGAKLVDIKNARADFLNKLTPKQ